LQDAGEPGIDGLTITLYQDDGDNIQEPGTDDVAIRFTTSANGGLYRFPNLTTGNYFAVFSNLPAGFSASPSHVGGDDNIDSDGLITPITNLLSTASDDSWDLGINGANLAGCNLAISNVTVSPCVNNGGVAEASVDVTLSWTGAPSGENIWVSTGMQSDTIDIMGGATSPTVIQFTVLADGSTNVPIFASFSGGLCVDSDGDSYNAPVSCLVEICNDNIDNDGDNLIDNLDPDCCAAQAPSISKD